MKDHEIILKMIEEVDPNDTEKLDEIDARVHNLIYPQDQVEQNRANGEWYNRREGWTFHGLQYTRSRDALKAIRPMGWLIGSISQDGDGWHCHLYLNYDTHGVSYGNKTEELAELHAVIQAIAYERELK